MPGADVKLPALQNRNARAAPAPKKQTTKEFFPKQYAKQDFPKQSAKEAKATDSDSSFGESDDEVAPLSARGQKRHGAAAGAHKRGSVGCTSAGLQEIFKKPGRKKGQKKVAVVEEDEHEFTGMATDGIKDKLNARAVMARSIYSKARIHLQNEPPAEYGRQHSTSTKKKLTFQGAGKAIVAATRQTVLARNMCSVFIKSTLDAKEVARLDAEMKQLEEEAERMMHSEEEGIKGPAIWLSSLIKEIEQLRAPEKQQTQAIQVHQVQLNANLAELMAKMEALKGLYSVNRKDSALLSTQIQTIVADTQRMMVGINETMGVLAKTMPDVSGGVFEKIRSRKSLVGIQNIHPPPSESQEIEGATETAAPAEDGSPSAERSDSADSRQPSRGLWRKAAICCSFEKVLFTATKSLLKDAIYDVEATCGHEAVKPLEDLVDFELDQASSPPSTSQSARDPGSIAVMKPSPNAFWTDKLHDESSMFSSVVEGLSSTLSAEEAKDWLKTVLRNAGIADVSSIHYEHPGMTDFSSMCREDAPEEIKGALVVKFLSPESQRQATEAFNAQGIRLADVASSITFLATIPQSDSAKAVEGAVLDDGANNNGLSRNASQTSLSPRAREYDMSGLEALDEVDAGPLPVFECVPLAFSTYQSIGVRDFVLPPCVQDLWMQDEHPFIERRLRCPFIALPLVPTRPRLPPVRKGGQRWNAARTQRHTPRKGSHTLEAVLREREQRGLRLDD